MIIIDTQLFLSTNDFARSTPWLQPIMLGYADYGIVLFAVLMVLGWWVARRRAQVAGMAAALWVPLGTLIAVGINQPIADLVGEERTFLRPVLTTAAGPLGQLPAVNSASTRRKVA